MNQGLGLKRVQILTHFPRARYFLVLFFFCLVIIAFLLGE